MFCASPVASVSPISTPPELWPLGDESVPFCPFAVLKLPTVIVVGTWLEAIAMPCPGGVLTFSTTLPSPPAKTNDGGAAARDDLTFLHDGLMAPSMTNLPLAIK